MGNEDPAKGFVIPKDLALKNPDVLAPGQEKSPARPQIIKVEFKEGAVAGMSPPLSPPLSP